MTASLSRREISKLVYNWIGVDGGYLGGFSYNSHDRFWLDVCDKHVSTAEFPGPTRECFIDTLYTATPNEQAAALEAILEDIAPPDAPSEDPKVRTSQMLEQIHAWIARLRTGEALVSADIVSPSDVVRRALADAETLLRESGATSAVDRVHTALHGYLRGVCADAGIEVEDGATMMRLLKRMRAEHEAFREIEVHGGETGSVLRGMGSVLDALNTLRNRASVAHPNETLLGEAEARLAVNASRTILNYLEARLRVVPVAIAVAGFDDEEPF